ncbi:AAA family ATPase [Nonomuraea sp. NPDC000554]|uniref:AAA family ATPase n=1 Tax=Nonomuraea sp. NPDC000554 TaxID=3154259 RepID=UPI00332D6A3D
MEWHFVGRSQQLETIRAALRDTCAGPIVIAGEPGAGRSALVEQVLESQEAAPYEVVRLRAADITGDITDRVQPAGGGRDLLLVVDDAHLSDHASLLSLRELGRRKLGTVLVTTLTGESARRPDPTDCLRFEPDARSLTLPPFTVAEVAALLARLAGGHVRQATALALHSASRGNAALLHDFLVARGLADRLVRGATGWEFAAVTEWRPRSGQAASLRHLVDATHEAWSGLAFDRAYELCKAAAWCGKGELVAAPLAHLLLLRGRPHDSMRFLDSLPESVVETTPHLALAKAINLACGLGRPGAAAEFLLHAALLGGARPQPRYLAYRAWIMALTGRAAEGLGMIDREDRETALFVHAAQAMTTLRVRPDEAVFHLRRALALIAGGMDPGPPWLSPHLTACLIDALLLTGRTGEATLLAAGFHGGEPSSGWDVAVAVSMVARTPEAA